MPDAQPDPPEHDDPGHTRAEPVDPSAEQPSWRDLHLWQIQPIRDVLAIAGVFGLLWLGYHLRLVTVPLLLAMTLAYLFEPIVKRLVRLDRINRQMAAGGIIVSAAVLIVLPLTLGAGFAVAQGVGYARTLAVNVDRLVESVENPDDERRRARLPNDAWIGLRDLLVDQQDPPPETHPETPPDSPQGNPQESDQPPASERERSTDDPVGAAMPSPGPQSDRSAVGEFADFLLRWVQTNAEAIAARALRTGQDAFSAALTGITRLGTAVFIGFLTAFFFFFISTGWGRVVEFWEGLIPERRKGRVIELAKMMDQVISGFVRGRVIIALILSVFFTIAYWIIGMPMPLILGPAVGLISIVPYVALISLPITIGAMLLDPQPLFAFQNATWWAIVAPIVVYQAGQLSDDYLLTPSIQGKTTDMDTPTILFASIAGGVLAGIYGLLLAIPVAACLKILLREVFWPEFRAWAQGERSDFLPIGRR